MDYEKMTEEELKKAIIDKFGEEDKRIYYLAKFTFVELCMEHDDDPLVQAYDKKVCENNQKQSIERKRIFNA